MILVILGTIKLEFSRILREIEENCMNNNINSQIIVQSGYTNYNSKYFHTIPFLKLEDLNKAIETADLIISHGGTGSIVNSIKKRKTVIAAVRYAEFGEHVDDHQMDIVSELSKKGYIIPWYKEDELSKLLEIAREFKPKTYVSNKIKIIKFVDDYISKLK